MTERTQRAERSLEVLRFLLIAWAASIPLSIAAAQIFAYPAALLTLYRWILTRDRSALHSPVFMAAVLFSAAALLAAALGPRPSVGLWKTRRLIVFLPLLLAVAQSRDPLKPGAFERRLGLAFLVGCALLALHDVVRIPLGAFHGEWIFGLGNMRDPQFYMTGLFLLFATGSPSRTRRDRWLIFMVLLLLTAGLLLHFKRGVWFSFAATLPLLCLVCRRWKPLILFLAAVALALLIPATRDRLLQAKSEFSRNRGGRMTLWTEVAPSLIRQYPMGMGMSVATNSDFRGVNRRVETKLNHLHNNALQVLLETGWIGLACWLTWMTLVFKTLIGCLRIHPDRASPTGQVALALLGAFTGLMLNGLVEFNFGDSEIFMLLFLLIGAAESLRPQAAARKTVA
ncbi:MAG: O-antigen ligase family protein [Kiritimatiellia bacterium]|nr:O-antigen ligase family protein [Kiritimatiellia bacterium]